MFRSNLFLAPGRVMFLLKEHCITPSASLQARSSRVSYKHTQWVFSALPTDLLKIKYDRPDLLDFLSLRSFVHVLSAVLLFSHFLSEEYKKHLLLVCLYPQLGKNIFYIESEPHKSSTQVRNFGRCTNPVWPQTQNQNTEETIRK